jgi:hypothetical protein
VKTELVELEKAIRLVDIDRSVLADFCHAVDNVRQTGWAVQEWYQRQDKEQDPNTVVSVLTLTRVRRATRLNNDICETMQRQDVILDSEGMSDLHKAVERLYMRMSRQQLSDS